MRAARARVIADAVSRWFVDNARPFPWRKTPRDPYESLVAETMLQQTQAARVAERLPRFLKRFPTLQALAGAEDDDVLALWSGLGYYRRAVNLRRAAQRVADEFGGEIPRDVERLCTLPGIGPYTAGAISSIVFNRREPIVDGNVARVLLRLGGEPLEHASKPALDHAWARARELVRAAQRPAVFNEALMELGALVCTPAGPDCAACPIERFCAAKRAGRQNEIPLPKARADKPVVHHASLIVTDDAGRVLLEKRPGRGLWAGLWQPPTVESPARPRPSEAAALVGASRARKIEAFDHHTTHRLVRFVVYRAPAPRGLRAGVRRWTRPADAAGLPLATPHKRMLDIAARFVGRERKHR